MRRSLLAVCLSSLAVVTATAAAACGSGSGNTDSSGNTYSCGSVGQKKCPNDPAQTQGQVDACNQCYSEAVAAAQCLGESATPACGADGTSVEETADAATTQRCATALAALIVCASTVDGGITAGDDDDEDFGEDGGSGVSGDQGPFFLDTCQMSASGPTGPATDSCAKGYSVLSELDGIAQLSLMGTSSLANSIEMSFPIPAAGLATGTTYTAPLDGDPSQLQEVSIAQTGYQCLAETGDTSTPFSGAGVSLSLVLSTYDPVNLVIHGTVTAATPCYSTTPDDDGGYDMAGTGATISITF